MGNDLNNFHLSIPKLELVNDRDAWVQIQEYLTSVLQPIVNVLNQSVIPSMGRDWVEIQRYTTPGNYNWTVPDLFGGKLAYEIAVFEIGGGGSGGAGCLETTTGTAKYQLVIASGGASGYTKLIRQEVTPGQIKVIVIGAGGSSKIVTTPITGNNISSGLSGGITSFAGNVVNGGKGGLVYASTISLAKYEDNITIYKTKVFGAEGGQNSDNVSWNYLMENIDAPSLGSFSYYNLADNIYKDSDINATAIYANNIAPKFPTSSKYALNPITLIPLLGAGGGAISRYNANSSTLYTASLAQLAPILPDGLKAGNGAAATLVNNLVLSAENASSPGSGGGAVAASAYNVLHTGYTIKSGSGAPGAAYIYARRKAS